MIHDVFDVSLHNVAELEPADWAGGGARLRRIPREVGAGLNVGGRERYRHPTGSELRFVPEDGAVEVTLSASGGTTVSPFWGPFQLDEPSPWGRTRRRSFPTTRTS